MPKDLRIHQRQRHEKSKATIDNTQSTNANGTRLYIMYVSQRIFTGLGRHSHVSGSCFKVQARRLATGSRNEVLAGRYGRGAAGVVLVAATAAVLIYNPGLSRSVEAEEKPAQADLIFEQIRRKATSTEDNRALISSQHLQVKKSWENPGVYAWGSNVGRVVAPESLENVIKTPQRIAFFDGQLLRDMKLDKSFGAAIAENGDLLQWGTAYSPECRAPQPTLVGKNLVKLSISRDRIIALSTTGTVYSIPVSKVDQQEGSKMMESSWFPFWKNKATISYRTLEPKSSSWGEKISDISSGLEHCLILTSAGRLFTVASGTEDFPMRGQLGVPGLTWTTRPAGRYDTLHEVSTLKGFDIKKIATGDHHSLALDASGRVFTFGDNAYGQLGFESSADTAAIDVPSLLPVDKLYQGTGQSPCVTHIAAGGANTYLAIDAKRIAVPGQETARDLGRITADVWSCGQGIYGSLGNGRWTHVQSSPTKIKALSGLFEYDEQRKTVVPIRLSHLVIGSNHAAAVLDNVTHTTATQRTSVNDTNWGADVLWFGSNEHYQLGTGKRNNAATPVYIPPLDAGAEKSMGRKEEHRFQLTPRGTFEVGGRWKTFEQRVECGRGCSAVYSGT